MKSGPVYSWIAVPGRTIYLNPADVNVMAMVTVAPIKAVSPIPRVGEVQMWRTRQILPSLLHAASKERSRTGCPETNMDVHCTRRRNVTIQSASASAPLDAMDMMMLVMRVSWRGTSFGPPIINQQTTTTQLIRYRQAKPRYLTSGGTRCVAPWMRFWNGSAWPVFRG